MEQQARTVLRNMKALRLASGLPQRRLAEAADLSITTISKYERGRSRPPWHKREDFLKTVAGVLEVEPGELLQGVQHPEDWSTPEWYKAARQRVSAEGSGATGDVADSAAFKRRADVLTGTVRELLSVRASGFAAVTKRYRSIVRRVFPGPTSRQTSAR